jgi:hypothetical protein
MQRMHQKMHQTMLGTRAQLRPLSWARVPKLRTKVWHAFLLKKTLVFKGFFENNNRPCPTCCHGNGKVGHGR